jgi:hypothetical protein
MFLITPTACITLVVPDEPDPTAVILYYNSVGFTDTMSIISLIEAYARDLPESAVVAQFYSNKTEADLPKWLIAFNNPANAEVYRTRKEWLETVLIEKGCKFNTGQTYQKPHPHARHGGSRN